MKNRHYVLSCKRKKWENQFIKCLEFKNEFLSFEKNNDHLPFRYLSRMHFSDDTIIHFFQQYIFMLLILDIVFGIRHYTLSIDHLQIRKVDFDQAFFFILDEKHQFYMDCPYGYHIYISGFEECFFKGVEHPLYIRSVPQNWNRIEPFTSFIWENVSPTFRNMLSHFQPVIFEMMVDPENELFFILCPLINVKHTIVDENSYSTNVVSTEIVKSFQIFLKEYKNLEKQFSNVERSKMVLYDWVDVLCSHKRDFFQDPDLTLGILRKVFYQYLIDHSMSYISFKSIDMTKFIVSLYLWSQWYERFLFHIPFWDQPNTDLITIVGCIDVYFKKQNHHQPKSLHVYDFILKSFTIRECPQGIDRVHPLLRTKYI
jgi:hypothetical protein